MLVFSRCDRLDLLPALPAAWPGGSIRGLPTRCGCVVDVAWSEGRLVSATLRAQRDTSLTVRYGERSATIRLGKGGTIQLDSQLRSANHGT
jgi:alpha-L-fucosidase 2